MATPKAVWTRSVLGIVQGKLVHVELVGHLESDERLEKTFEAVRRLEKSEVEWCKVGVDVFVRERMTISPRQKNESKGYQRNRKIRKRALLLSLSLSLKGKKKQRATNELFRIKCC